MKFRVLDLFSGIGGFSLGLERTGGFETVAFCEIEPFPRQVLAKHWPNTPIYEDVRELTAERLAADGIGVDVICGGFPCQDVSLAGAGAGLDGERSGLWSEIARLSRELQPQYVIVENVSALLSRGLGRVLGDLAEIGFDAEWHCIPASALGAEHGRDRIWIIAHSVREGLPLRIDARADSPNAPIFAAGLGSAIRTPPAGLERSGAARWGGDVYGVPNRAHRIKALGNAVVPQIPEIIGRAILAAANSQSPRLEAAE
jgi:DNA (cytosine-5)-methyltransferase 1